MNKFVYFDMCSGRLGPFTGGRWLYQHAPDFLWSFSLTYSLFIVVQTSSFTTLGAMSIISLTLSFLFEFGQKIHFVNGTFDVMDLIMYVIGNCLACGIFAIQRRRQKLRICG